MLVFPSNLCSPVRVLIGMLLFWLFLNVKEPDVGYFGGTGRLWNELVSGRLCGLLAAVPASTYRVGERHSGTKAQSTVLCCNPTSSTIIHPNIQLFIDSAWHLDSVYSFLYVCWSSGSLRKHWAPESQPSELYILLRSWSYTTELPFYYLCNMLSKTMAEYHCIYANNDNKKKFNRILWPKQNLVILDCFKTANRKFALWL